MKILALEFSSSHRSVAAVELDPRARPQAVLQLAELPAPTKLAEVIESGCGTTMQPFRMIQDALTQAGLDRTEIECIGVGLGPGSYTGIRAAIAIAQGWQLARNVKLVGISSVAAIVACAWERGIRGACSVVIDAQRNEFYLASYQLDDAGGTETEPLRLVSFDEVRRLAAASHVLIGPDIHQWFAAAQPVHPSAPWIARLAAAQNQFVSGDRLEPIYLRETSFVKAPTHRIQLGMS